MIVTGKIYLTTNRINGKIYIGQTITNSKSYLGSGVALKKAIKKYGRKNFYRVILIDNIQTKEQLNYLEMFFIRLYNSTHPFIGYNMDKPKKGSYRRF